MVFFFHEGVDGQYQVVVCYLFIFGYSSAEDIHDGVVPSGYTGTYDLGKAYNLADKYVDPNQSVRVSGKVFVCVSLSRDQIYHHVGLDFLGTFDVTSGSYKDNGLQVQSSVQDLDMIGHYVLRMLVMGKQEQS